MSPAHEIRELTAADMPAIEQLSAESFGRAANPAAQPKPGASYLGAVVDGDVAAKVTSRSYHSHFHGTTVPTCGIASVAVAGEHRGQGLLSSLLPVALENAHRDGAVVAGLFPTAVGIYRGFGFEPITSLDEVELSLPDLLGATAPDASDLRVRRARLADIPAVRECYDRWGTGQNGPLTRRGRSFPLDDQGLLDHYHPIFLAERGESVEGYCLWRHDHGFGPDVPVEVDDLVAISAAAEAVLLQTLGGFGTVAGTARIRISGPDSTRWIRRAGAPRLRKSIPYCLAILDVPQALGLLPAAEVVTQPLTIQVSGRAARDEIAGHYRITPDGTESAPDPGTAVPVFTPGGLAAWWSGAAGPAELRMAGKLSGPADADAVLDRLIPRRPVRILDYY